MYVMLFAREESCNGLIADESPPARTSSAHLQLSSPEFYAACAASPAPPLSLVFGSRGLASRQAVFMRLSLLRAAAGGSAAREIRATAAETGIKREAERGTVTEHLMEKEQSALEMLEVRN